MTRGLGLPRQTQALNLSPSRPRVGSPSSTAPRENVTVPRPVASSPGLVSLPLGLGLWAGLRWRGQAAMRGILGSPHFLAPDKAAPKYRWRDGGM